MPSNVTKTGDQECGWSEIEEQFAAKIGQTISVNVGGRTKSSTIRVKATPVKTFAAFVLVEVHAGRRHRYRECFLYADFITGEQPSNNLAA